MIEPSLKGLLLKPGPRPSTRTQKNQDSEKPGSGKTWTLKNLNPEKSGPKKTCTLKNLNVKKNVEHNWMQ